MSVGIYKIENLVNHKVYIGQSIHIERRWIEHCQPSNTSLIGKAIQEFGKENFSFQILETTDDLNKLNELETQYIKQFNSLFPQGYNKKYEDAQEHHQFLKYSQEEFFNIVQDIKNNEMSFKEIADKYNLDLSMIYYINRGDYHTLSNETYPLRPVKDVSKQYHYCCDCGIELKTNSKRCVKCSQIAQRKAQRPLRSELKKLIQTTSFVEIGRQFGVTDNAIRKWCKQENLPYKKCDIAKYSFEEWEKI